MRCECEGPDPGWQPLTGDSWSPAPASPGWVIGCMVCMVTSARDITIKTSRILRMSAVLNGIRNPNCPDYNAHSGLSAWSCVNLIKYLAPSISCGPQTLETNTDSVPLSGSQGMQRSPSLSGLCLVSGAWVSHQTGVTVHGPLSGSEHVGAWAVSASHVMCDAQWEMQPQITRHPGGKGVGAPCWREGTF